MFAPIARLAVAAICFTLLVGPASADEVSLPGLGGQVEVYVDGYGIPHVYAQSWTDAAMVLGYLHASDRLWEMDMFRRQASGTTAEILGKDSLPSDIFVRQLGLRRDCEALWQSDQVPGEFRNELEAYAAGVNAKIAELADDGLPGYFRMLRYQPAPWTPVDSLVFTKYMGWDQSGTDSDLWFGTMVEKLGAAAVEELWPLDRPYEIPTVKVQADRAQLTAARLVPIPGAAPAYRALQRRMEAATWHPRGVSFGSNNWAVSGDKTASGKPILASDPHLGFQLPSIWYTCHLSVGDENVAGVTFPGGPVVVIGHNDRIAWGITNMQADAVDYFVETMHPDDALQYQHRGQWKPVRRITEEIRVRGGSPHTLHIDHTVHGPIMHREGQTIAMQWSGFGPTPDAVALWRVNRAKNLPEYLAALDMLMVPPLNMVYADVDGNIALHPCGALPLRKPGQGRIPMDGASGDHDWAGFIPRDELPLAVNPPDGFVASANGRPASIGYPHYLGWMWDESYRTRRIHDLLTKANDLTIDTMKPLQNDAYDLAAERYLSVLLPVVEAAELDDSFQRQVVEQLRNWDYVAGPDAIGPIIWLRWFQHYRRGVWDDEWSSRGIEKQPGSWGFTGNNQREPMLEVLEYITHEQPHSVWFDDRNTSQRETRDDIALRTFSTAVASLREQFGDDMSAWAWKNINRLRIASLTREDSLARTGGPVPGTAFTVNPGSNGGHVGGGASWRMLVDFGDASTSVGVYPGGQRENPASPHYDDQIAVWAAGQYVPLDMHRTPDALPERAKMAAVTFVP